GSGSGGELPRVLHPGIGVLGFNLESRIDKDHCRAPLNVRMRSPTILPACQRSGRPQSTFPRSWLLSNLPPALRGRAVSATETYCGILKSDRRSSHDAITSAMLGCSSPP